jgi:branched-chain amino acid transport system substrate-binding protein
VTRRRLLTAGVAATAAAALVLTACSSSKDSSSKDSQGASGSSSTAAATSTIKIGVITDSSGVASSGYLTTEKGIKAYADAVNAAGGVNGQKISYVMADSQSTASGALTAAEKLVETDKVFAIVEVTAFFYSAEPYLLKQGVPVLGQGSDGPEWRVKTNTNLFPFSGVSLYDKTYTPTGIAMKALGATSCGSLGYAGSPSSTQGAAAALKSCQSQGLKSGVQSSVAFGSTDMAPVALAMKNAGVDGVYAPVVPNTAFALAAALRQVGVKPKAFILATGYGGDLLQSSAAVTAAQGFQFLSTGEPVEMNTPATQKLAKNFAAVGVSTTPTYAEQVSYLSMAALARGLQAAGAAPTRQKFIDSLRSVKDFDGDGLLAPLKVDFSDYEPAKVCLWLVTLTGTKFVPVPAASPVCGGMAS